MKIQQAQWDDFRTTDWVEILYRTMRLEGEAITRKETQALFK